MVIRIGAFLRSLRLQFRPTLISKGNAREQVGGILVFPQFQVGLQLVLRINDAVFRVRQTARQDDHVCFLKIGIKEGRNELSDIVFEGCSDRDKP